MKNTERKVFAETGAGRKAVPRRLQGPTDGRLTPGFRVRQVPRVARRLTPPHNQTLRIILPVRTLTILT